MTNAPQTSRLKSDLLGLVRAIPRGRVATYDDFSQHLKAMQPLLLTLLGRLSEDERDMAPWHRVVAKGGAIGRGPHRDQQFARLMREGVGVSPAGVVQDMPRRRIAVSALSQLAAGMGARIDACDAANAPPAQSASRSRGMRERPDGGSRA